MPNDVYTSKNLAKLQTLLAKHLVFSNLTHAQISELAHLMSEINYRPGEIIVKEYDFVDSIFFIMQGKVQVSQCNAAGEKFIVGILKEEDTIGLSQTGFFSPNGKRTATVTALTETTTFKLDIFQFNSFLNRYPEFNTQLTSMSELMLRLDLIKKLFPFQQLSNDEIYTTAHEAEDIFYPENTDIFYEGDPADQCYLLQKGKVEIVITQASGNQITLAILEPPQLFGEAAIFTNNKRNATARTLTDCKLITLKRQSLEKLFHSSTSFAQSLMVFMVNRFRPQHAENISIHQRTTKDGRLIITLHNLANDNYYQLIDESWFIWQQLDGLKTIEDLTITFFNQYRAFIPEVICNLIYGMAEAGFVNIPTIQSTIQTEIVPLSKTQKFINKLKNLFNIELVFTNTDDLFTKFYNYFAWILFIKPSQILIGLFILLTFALFFSSYHRINNNLVMIEPNFLTFILILIPISIIEIILHEAGHAFAAKHFKYKIDRVGIGWLGLTPVAFTDTSQLWLAPPQIRFKIDFAGIYVDLLVASIISFIASFSSLTTAFYLWLTAFFVYLNAFKNLSVIKEYDGYFLLTHFFDYPRLQSAAIQWLLNALRAKKKPKLIMTHQAEIFYWLSCLVYIFMSSIFIFLLCSILFKFFLIDSIYGIQSFYISLLFSIITFILITSSLYTRIKEYL